MNAGGNGTPNHRKNFVAWNKGKTGCYTEESRRRISEGRRGIPVSEEQRKKMSEARKGQRLSEETKKKLSAAHMGKIPNEEARRHMSEAHKGKPLSEKHKKSLEGLGSKPVLMYSRAGDFIKEFSSITSAAMYLGVNRSAVSNVLTGKSKSAGGGLDRKAGYTFRYKNENPDR